MNEEQFKSSITVVNYLWTIGIIDFSNAREIVHKIEHHRAAQIMKENREKRIAANQS